MGPNCHSARTCSVPRQTSHLRGGISKSSHVFSQEHGPPCNLGAEILALDLATGRLDSIAGKGMGILHQHGRLCFCVSFDWNRETLPDFR